MPGSDSDCAREISVGSHNHDMAGSGQLLSNGIADPADAPTPQERAVPDETNRLDRLDSANVLILSESCQIGVAAVSQPHSDLLPSIKH
jgi:hypothetical protein